MRPVTTLRQLLEIFAVVILLALVAILLLAGTAQAQALPSTVGVIRFEARPALNWSAIVLGGLLALLALAVAIYCRRRGL